MNRKYSIVNRLPHLVWHLAGLGFWAVVFVILNAAGLPRTALGQMTLDGTHCVLFADQPAGELVRCVARRADSSTLMLSLMGTPPNKVRQIELRIDGAAPFQIIDVDARPIIDRQNVGMLIRDMNFDGHDDFAIMDFAPAGPNVPYVYFLFNGENKLFENSLALADITAPQFDTGKEQITSAWRDGAARGGRDIYIWQQGVPVLSERIERLYSNNRCEQRRFVLKSGKLQLVETGACGE